MDTLSHRGRVAFPIVQWEALLGRGLAERTPASVNKLFEMVLFSRFQ